MKRFTSLCIALTLLIIVLSISPAFSAIEKSPTIEPLQESYDNDLNKLHFYFGLENTEDKTGSASARTVSNELSVDDDYFTYIDTETELSSAIDNMNSYCDKYVEDNELIQITVEFKSDFEKTPEYMEFQEKKENIKTIQDLRKHREELIEFSKQYHSSQNRTNIRKLDSFNYKNIYALTLSPFVTMEIDKNRISYINLLDLANDSSVVNISLSLEETFIDEEVITWERALKATDIYSTVHSGLYTGEGVKIGILERRKCNISNANLSGKSIEINPTYNSVEVAEHATAVTSIISLIAPDADLFFSSVIGDLDQATSLEWLITKGCDVINCSYGLPVAKKIENSIPETYSFSTYDAGYRHDIDGLFDYQVKANAVNIVVSAGNVNNDNQSQFYNPEGYVTSPGLAHNVVTVGGLECDWNLFSHTLEHATNSCYKTIDSTVKPEVSAIHSLEIPNIGEKSGTSFAAPQVTGAIALIMCKYVENALNPTAIKSMLISGANQTDDHLNISNSFFDQKIGAGCVSLDNLEDSECIIYMGSNNSSSLVNSFVYSYDISLRRNDILQNSVSWFAHFDDTNNTLDASDFNIMVYNSSGNLVASSSLGEFNTSEFIRYKAPSAGTYTIKVYQNGTLADGVVSEPFVFVCNIL